MMKVKRGSDTLPAQQLSRQEPCEVTALLRQLTRQVTPHAIEWLVEGKTFMIRGCVTSYYQKQLATTIARRMPGIERIVNELEVRPRTPRGDPAGNERN